jgi:hypothetical protein
MAAAANSSILLRRRKEGANTKDMMPINNTAFPINKSPSIYLCSKCTAKPADYYVLTGENPKSPTEMIPLCDVCYPQQHNRRRFNRTWYYHQHPRNGELHTMHAAYVDAMLISYVLEALPQYAQIVKPAMLKSMGMKHLKSSEKREAKSREEMTMSGGRNGKV